MKMLNKAKQGRNAVYSTAHYNVFIQRISFYYLKQ